MKIKKITTALVTLVFGLGVMGSSFAIKHECSSTYFTCMGGNGDASQCYAVFVECLQAGN
jgi:hypothetical protein